MRPARVLFVSSGGMYTRRLDVDDLQSRRGTYDGRVAYARTKRAEVVLAERWAAALAGTGVVVHAMHPGWADTPGIKSSLPAFQRIMRPLLRTPEQGADTIVWLAAAEEPGRTTGRFWCDRHVRATHRLARTQRDCRGSGSALARPGRARCGRLRADMICPSGQRL